METDGRVEKQSTVFPHVLAKRLGAFCTVPTGFTAVNPQTTKPDISLATKTGHFYLLPTPFIFFKNLMQKPNAPECTLCPHELLCILRRSSCKSSIMRRLGNMREKSRDLEYRGRYP